jgi:mono/diheme cytochrome c family protein
MCHGADGEGRSGIGSDLRAQTDLEHIARLVRNGGVEMPAFAGALQPQEIEQVSKFVAVQLGK